MKLLNCEIQVQDPDRAVLNISMYEITDCEKGFYEKGLHLSLLCKISCCAYCLSSFNKNINEYSFLRSNFIEITHRHGCSPVNLMHIFRTPFPKNTSGRLLLYIFERTSRFRKSMNKNNTCLVLLF